MRNFHRYEESSVMGWGNRGWLEIIEFILIACTNGALKTHVMYKCNLNSQQVHQYFDFLLSCKLLERKPQSPDSRRFIYKTTTLGRRYMDAYAQIAEIFKPPGTNKKLEPYHSN